MTPTVDVCMLTYNHAAFVQQAIESVLAQQTNFLVRLVIGDDGST
jgi:glycosyltransferase involved in cell wall biosynthesis